MEKNALDVRLDNSNTTCQSNMLKWVKVLGSLVKISDLK